MPTARRKVRDREEAVELLEEHATGTQTLRAFCAARRIDARSLHCWKLNLARPGSRGSRGPALRLVELVAKPSRADRRYLLHVGDVTIEVGDDFEDEQVARLVALARAC